MFESYGEMLFRVDRWHATEDYASIIDLLGARPIGELNFELTLRLAQAHIADASVNDDDFRERMGFAERLLIGIESAGLSDGEWCLAMGEALYWLNQDKNALPYLERAVALQPMNAHAHQMRLACFGQIERCTVVRPVTLQRIADYYESENYKFDIVDDGALMVSGFAHAFHSYTVEPPFMNLVAMVRSEELDDDDLVAECNQWNCDTKQPKAFIRWDDDGVLWVYAEVQVLCGSGMTDELFENNIDFFIRTSEDFFRRLQETYPELAQER